MGGAGSAFTGSQPVAALIAAWTSCPAEAMSRVRLNCSVIWLVPYELVDVIRVRPGIRASWYSSGAETEDCITSGEAPG